MRKEELISLNGKFIASVLAGALLLAGSPVALGQGGAVTSSLVAGGAIRCGDTATLTLTVQGHSPPPALQPVDVMLTLDVSGSMAWQSTTMPNMQAAAKGFIDIMDQGDGQLDGQVETGSIGLVSFATRATLQSPLTHDGAAVKAKIEGLTAYGVTNTAAAINLAQEQLAGAPHKRVLILMTDGVPTSPTDGRPSPEAWQAALDAAVAAKGAGTEIYTIGLGQSLDEPLLREIASGAEHYYPAPSDGDLASIFSAIARGVTGPAATHLRYEAEISGEFELVGASASRGTATTSGSSISWNLDELRTEAVVLTYQVRHRAAAGGRLPVHSQAALTWIGSDGAARALSHADAAVEVEGCDRTPPETTLVPDGTLGQNGWYVSPVQVTAIAADNPGGSGVDRIMIAAEREFQPYTALVTIAQEGVFEIRAYAVDRAGNTEAPPAALTLKIDTAAPVITYTGNAGVYTVDETVHITCDAQDATSGIAENTCHALDGPAYGFAVGDNTFTATAADRAGNEDTGTVTFRVIVTYRSLCELTKRFVTKAGVAHSLCVKLDQAERAETRGNAAAKSGALGAYLSEVQAQAGKAISADKAAVLERLALGLM